LGGAEARDYDLISFVPFLLPTSFCFVSSFSIKELTYFPLFFSVRGLVFLRLSLFLSSYLYVVVGFHVTILGGSLFPLFLFFSAFCHYRVWHSGIILFGFLSSYSAFVSLPCTEGGVMVTISHLYGLFSFYFAFDLPTLHGVAVPVSSHLGLSFLHGSQQERAGLLVTV
jgi:hypothetical protein